MVVECIGHSNRRRLLQTNAFHRELKETGFVLFSENKSEISFFGFDFTAATHVLIRPGKRTMASSSGLKSTRI